MATTKLVSFSELDSYRQCKLKHHLGYRERYKEPTQSPALAKGSLMHEVLELHFRILQAERGEKDHTGEARPVDQVAANRMRGEREDLLADPDTGAQDQTQELVEWMYEGYVGHYGDDPDWEILEVERKFEMWLPTAKGTRSSFRFKGKIDLLVRDHSMGGGLWLVDHKTGRNLPREKELDLDDQMALYTYLLRHRGLDIRGVIYNAIRTEKLKTREMDPSERFDRRPITRLETELETVALEAYEQFLEAYHPRPEGKLPPRSPDTDRCRWRCPFTEPCLANRKGRDIHAALDEFGFEVDLERH